MCVRAFKIKSTALYGVRKAFIPCGKCEECRQSLKNQWSFRIRTELEFCKQRKWHIGFFTLTYNDSHLPTIPVECWNDDREFRPVPCFSRKDLRDFIDNIRKRLFEEFHLSKDKRISYLLACEYGSDTKRPHAHGVISFPPEVPPRRVFELIKDNWTDKGFVIPRDIRGGVDSKGRKHKPFLLDGAVAGAANYVAKYVCKDLDYEHSIHGLPIDKRAAKGCMPFHIQSKSIGLRYFVNKSAEDLLIDLKNGASFVGLAKRVPLPLYIKNKIIYTPYYQFEQAPNADWWYDFGEDKWRYKKGEGTHKRLVRKRALDFFKENLGELYSQKCDYYEELFTQMKSLDYWTSKKMPSDIAFNVARIAQRLEDNTGFSSRRLAEGYVTYYGVPKDRCFAVGNYPLFWLSRYEPSLKWSAKRTPLINDTYYRSLNEYIGFLMDALKFCKPLDVEKRARVAKIIDRYKSLL